MPGAEGYTTFRNGDRPLGGLGGHQPGSPKDWTTCFSVAGADDAVATVEQAGGKITMAPDPWGAPFSVMQDPPAA